ncbi:MAG TPA: sugar phosphate nucleotidyltransferase [Gammaproteobacteria bacterium]|jgi:glucose-1-phosphate adenylyltransferase
MIEASSAAASAVAVVLAGGKGTRLGALTRHVCKPAIPFGGAYRSIDFSLSNCVNSGIVHVGVATQHKPEALLGHISRVWRDVVTDREHFITPWAAEERAPGRGYLGTADAVFRNLDTIGESRADLVLVLAGDHIYKMDYRPLLAHHVRHNADVTVGCVEVAAEEAHHFGIMSLDDDGRICRFVEKPKTLHEVSPSATGRLLASMGIYVFDTHFLASVLRRDAASSVSRHDFGCDILPDLIDRARVFAYPFRGDEHRPGYWRDIGTPTAYWRAHLDLLDPSAGLRIDDPSWPLRAASTERSILRYVVHKSADRLERSLVAGRCAIQGATVRRSVLFADVRVSPRSEVTESVILPGAVIGRHCRLQGAIVDRGCHIPDGTVIDRTARRKDFSDAVPPAIVTQEHFQTRFTRPATTLVGEGAMA